MQALNINQNTLQLDNGKSRVSVVELDSDLVGEFLPGALGLLEAAHNIIQRGRHPEVLLLQSQFFTLVQVVVGIQHGANGLGSLLVCDCAFVVAIVEFREIKLASRRLARPEPQVVCCWGRVARNRHIVGNSINDVTTLPDADGLTVLPGVLTDLAIELDLTTRV